MIQTKKMIAIIERPITDSLMNQPSQKLVGDWSLKSSKHFFAWIPWTCGKKRNIKDSSWKCTLY